MEANQTKRKELEEVERQLRSVDIELERMVKEIPNFEERVRIAEQKNLEEQTKKGIDPVNVQPSKDQRLATTTLEQAQKAIEKFQQRKRELRGKIETLQVSLLEEDLIHLSRLHAKLKEREGELESELEEVRSELAQVAEKKEALALKIAEQSQRDNG
ncbi:MAG: hypothetical protein KC931_08780 [Candidatus Omnitrophica bacterium]|nr:hypothetical protein [Candidatus Omnitrophota bacterium]MCA9415725.1 hypothetical protein [Candidatus Omnitrophota bacterium]MCA9427065.1 hypothetical protein [Candidatus Omnitrophota bacterium]MCA9440086.1 hypothetical protein [Candidatus Omnitrophota bacterium]MCA9447199.1 hypothetical protein [Candidatus Omnitrophota bacterium]